MLTLRSSQRAPPSHAPTPLSRSGLCNAIPARPSGPAIHLAKPAKPKLCELCVLDSGSPTPLSRGELCDAIPARPSGPAIHLAKPAKPKLCELCVLDSGSPTPLSRGELCDPSLRSLPMPYTWRSQQNPNSANSAYSTAGPLPHCLVANSAIPLCDPSPCHTPGEASQTHKLTPVSLQPASWL